MAGTNIRSYLSHLDPDRFYELYHALSEEVLSRTSLLSTASEILQFQILHSPDFSPDDDDAARLEAFKTGTQDLVSAMHSFFWPAPADDPERNKVLIMQRWAPYDEAAWDRMAGQMTDILQPFLQAARRHYEEARSLASRELPNSESMAAMLAPTEKYLDGLSQLFTAEGIESLFRLPPGQT